MKAALLLPALLLGHIITGEYGPVRLFFMKVFARYIEVPLLHLSYMACVGRLRFLSRFSLTRLLIVYPIAYPFGHWGDTGRPVPVDELLKMVDELPGKIAVGPCRCRIGHKACDHPLETDIVIRTGADVWLEAFPHKYRVIDKEETKGIIGDCAERGMFHVVFMHCLVGGAVNEYVICNCCTDGCVPYILNRRLGQTIFPLEKGERRATVKTEECERCGTCVRVCPFSARRLDHGVPRVLECYGCGLCASNCPSGATRMHGVRDPILRYFPGNSSRSHTS